MEKAVLGFLAVAIGLSQAGCIPDLQPAVVCAPEVTVPYLEAPASLRPDRLQQALDAYVALSGQWSAELQCPDGYPNTGPVTVTIQTSSLDEMRMVVGSDPSQLGSDCSRKGTVLAGGQIAMTGPSLGGLSGQTATMSVDTETGLFGWFRFDPSYDPSLESVGGSIYGQRDLSFLFIIVFAHQFKRNPDGSFSQEGYDCGLNLLARI